MLVVALTGGIGSGKTTASQLFEKLGTPVIDADEIARLVVQPGQPALTEVIKQFGPSILTAEGLLDRTKLRQIIFNDAEKKRLLEAILHPRIREEMTRRLSKLSAPYCIVVIPLLVESNQMEIADRILVIDTPEALQLSRVTQRDHQTASEVSAIITAQATRDARLAVADDIILNDGDLKKLQQQVESHHQKYSSLSKTFS